MGMYGPYRTKDWHVRRNSKRYQLGGSSVNAMSPLNPKERGRVDLDTSMLYLLLEGGLLSPVPRYEQAMQHTTQ